MLVTEQEAREKWCPCARTAIGEDFEDDRGMQLVSANRAMDYQTPHHCRCIASECMFWRWADEYEVVVKSETATGKANRRGYCGLAGPIRTYDTQSP